MGFQCINDKFCLLLKNFSDYEGIYIIMSKLLNWTASIMQNPLLHLSFPLNNDFSFQNLSFFISKILLQRREIAKFLIQ
jgi:hypothetical protein